MSLSVDSQYDEFDKIGNNPFFHAGKEINNTSQQLLNIIIITKKPKRFDNIIRQSSNIFLIINQT